MTLSEIKEALKNGKRVKWATDAYDVVRSKGGEYLIVCNLNQYTIGLTWQDGKTMNGKEADFYVA